MHLDGVMHGSFASEIRRYAGSDFGENSDLEFFPLECGCFSNNLLVISLCHLDGVLHGSFAPEIRR
jgi:hypothetical protein